VTIPALIKGEVELQDARGYAPLGCAEVMIPGKSTFRTMGLNLKAVKLLELVMNGGVSLTSGKKVLENVPDTFPSFEALYGCYAKQYEIVVSAALEMIEDDEKNETNFHPRPWLTLLTHGGVEKGIEFANGLPKYNCQAKTHHSIANIANAMFVINRLVFEEKSFTFEEFRDILRSNWEGQEPLRQFILNKLPRFGQDNMEVDRFAKMEAKLFADTLRKHRSYYGGPYWPMIFGLQYQDKAEPIAASADGRKASDPLAVTLAPTQLGLRGAITEVLNSVTAIDFSDFCGGVSDVQDFDPNLFSGETGLENLMSVLRGFFQRGAMEIGPNFIDEETLLAAQKDPAQYTHVMVRLFGLSARFVTLSPQIQEAFIRKLRTAKSGGRNN